MTPINISNSNNVNVIAGSEHSSISSHQGNQSVAEVEIFFDLFEYEDELIPGHSHIPTYGIEAINHMPHAIRVTDHIVEGLVNGNWIQVPYALFNDRTERITWDEGDQGYVRYDKSLPKTIEPNGRKLWRILSLNGFMGIVRGVIIADRRRYESATFQISKLIQAESIIKIG